MPAKPKWRELYIHDPAKTMGRVLCSFQLVPKAKAGSHKLHKIRPPMRRARVDLDLLGLRNLVRGGRRLCRLLATLLLWVCGDFRPAAKPFSSPLHPPSPCVPSLCAVYPL